MAKRKRNRRTSPARAARSSHESAHPAAALKALRPLERDRTVEQMGAMVIADFALIGCPTWRADLGPDGEVVPVRDAPPYWGMGQFGPCCARCGKVIELTAEEGCPAMLDQARAIGLLVRLKLPKEQLHEVPA